MTGGRMYLDVGAARIQHYISRTPRLKGQRGASSWLSWATSNNELAGQTRVISGRPGMPQIEPNPEAGQADGLISVRLPGDADPRPVAEELAAYLRSALPAIELTAIWGPGDTYLEAYRDHMKAQRDDPPLRSLPPPADFPPLASCGECRAAPAVARVVLHDKKPDVCPDCLARYRDCYRRPGLAAQALEDQAGGLPIYQEEARLARALDAEPVKDTAQDFSVLAALGGPDTQRNHIATVYADGNSIGAFFDRVAAHGEPGLKQRISAAVSQVTRDALREATRAALGPPSAGQNLPVIPHVVGGDDLLVSVTADRAWQFTVTYLAEFSQRLSAISDLPGELLDPVPPTASAGVVFTHAKFPFRRSAELAAGRLREAKREFRGTVPAVAWLDVTRDGEQPPAHRHAWALDDLTGLADALRALRDDLDPSGRAVLERLVDPARPTVSVARLNEHARRMERAQVLEPFLRDGDPAAQAARMAEALSVARWWR